MPQVVTYTYQTTDHSITIHGFIASLLLQGENWDIRCQNPMPMTIISRTILAWMPSLRSNKKQTGSGSSIKQST